MPNSFTSLSEPARQSRLFVGLVLMAILLFIAGVEVTLRLYVVQSDPYARRAHWVYAGEGSNIALGDSHVEISMRGLPGFVNLGLRADSPRTMEIVAREYYRYRKPGKVILMASPQFFCADRIGADATSATFFRQHQWLPFGLYAFEPAINKYLRGPWSRYKTEEEPQWSLQPEEEKQKKVKRRVEAQRPVPGFMATRDYRAYRSTLEYLRNIGAEVCLVRTPVSAEYLAAISSDPAFEAAQEQFRRLAGEFGFSYVDFRSLPPLGPDDFRDHDHLNLSGAKRFSARLPGACFK